VDFYDPFKYAFVMAYYMLIHVPERKFELLKN